MNTIKSITAALTIGMFVLFSACGVTQDTVDRTRDERRTDPFNDRPTQVVQNPQSLEDFLVRAPGVFVRGSQVSIRGGGPPLFIIDGVPIGNSYLSAVNAVNPQDIQSVEVVSGPETAFYGRRGANGVIIINTKRAS